MQKRKGKKDATLISPAVYKSQSTRSNDNYIDCGLINAKANFFDGLLVVTVPFAKEAQPKVLKIN